MHSNRYTLLFVFIVTVVLGTLLSVTKENLKDKQEDNLRADVNKTILRSLDFSEEEDNPWSNEKVEEIFNNSIIGLCVDLEGNKIDNVVLEEIDIERDVKRLPVYLKVVEGELQGIALPVAGKGLWSTLFGYFAVETALPELNGPIPGPRTLLPDNSPYIVTGDVQVLETNNLTIPAGIEILFDDNFGIEVSGELVVSGEENNGVIFKHRYDTGPGSWKEIKFTNTAINLVLDADNNVLTTAIITK